MGSASDWLIATNNSMGMIAFAMVMMMINMDMWRIDSHPRSWVRWMVYFDATAFTVLYAYQLTADLFHTCQQVNAILLLAEFIWSIKDAFKYGFIIHKSLLINNMHMKWPPYAAAATSLVFYWVYMLQYYGFGEGCIPPLPGNWALISKVMVASEQLVSGMGHEGTQKQMETEVQIFGVYKLREEVRLLICVGGMGGVSALAVIRKGGCAQFE
ncbi:hypothetical protein HDU79_002454 [Rhizoclosmatium sp. JEL0117]|nr:hypothetical protein HDU79_002454 [Rhizoclosmatium sp. JEL0117]